MKNAATNTEQLKLEEIASPQDIAIAKTETELEKVINQTGIDLSEAENIKAAYLPFLSLYNDIMNQASKIDKNNPTSLDEDIASTLRKATMKIRTSALKFKDDRKSEYLLKGNIEQAAYNLIANTCKLAEIEFEKIEKATEIKEAARKELLKKDRLEMLLPFGYVNDGTFDLGSMEQNMFDMLKRGIVNEFNEKNAAIVKAEVERIAKEKAEAEAKKKLEEENAKLKIEADAKDKLLAEQKEKAAADLAETNRIAKIESDKQAKIIADQKAEAKRIAENVAKAALEASEAIKAANEILRLRKEAEEKALKEAAKAPDKDKIFKLVMNMNLPSVDLNQEESKQAWEDIRTKFEGFKAWALTKANSL